MASQGQPDAIVQGGGASTNGDYKQWQIRQRARYERAAERFRTPWNAARRVQAA